MAGGFDYQRYLASREWALLRRQVIARADGGRLCERCDNRNHDGSRVVAAVHHLTYERIGTERLDDLQAVCGPCHAYLSGVSDEDPVEAFLAQFAAAARRSGYLGWAQQIERELVAWRSLSPKPASYGDWQSEEQKAGPSDG